LSKKLNNKAQNALKSCPTTLGRVQQFFLHFNSLDWFRHNKQNISTQHRNNYEVHK